MLHETGSQALIQNNATILISCLYSEYFEKNGNETVYEYNKGKV